jgi:hypothetical protein
MMREPSPVLSGALDLLSVPQEGGRVHVTDLWAPTRAVRVFDELLGYVVYDDHRGF